MDFSAAQPSTAWSSAITPEADKRLSRFPVEPRAMTKHRGEPRDVVSRQPRQPRQPLFVVRRFWADFTLGFSDGLTVPFALTAGLSSLGRTDTVVYAGLAEVTAGCISMGISGFLSARQANAGLAAAVPLSANETTAASAVVARHVVPLGLPADLETLVIAHVKAHPPPTPTGADTDANADNGYVSPVVTGLSVAVGYIVGGILPLWPYFFVVHVGDGLRWSVGVCIVALFLFGFLQVFCREGNGNAADALKSSPTRRLWESTLGGLQMVAFCGIAVLAAGLCVYVFEGKIEDAER
ncbi:hypothetical protein SCUCBS95973_006560 [Sporothrix curviconia]|uniref:Vacuolar iron transporter n=1 Tax=Sporothrix curviconia TaxID=1260050 RepID=A0ABP0C639_9PEZI